MKRTGRQMKRSGRQVKGSGRQASREPDHKHPAWETNEKNWETNEKKWETNERKWETSQPGTRPQAPRQMKRTTSFHLSPTSFHLSPSSFRLSPRLGACGRVPGWLVSRFLSCVSRFFSFVSHVLSFVSHFFSFVSQFFSFVSQAGCFFFSFVLHVHFFSFVSQFWVICLPGLGACWICLPLLFICLPSWVLVVGFPAGLSPTSCHLSPSSFHLSPRLGACGRVPGRSPTSFRLGACGRVPGWLVSHFLLFVSHFFSFVSQAGCLFPAGLSPTSLHLSPTFAPNSLLLGVLNSFLRCVTAGVRPFPCFSQVCHAAFPFSACSISFVSPRVSRFPPAMLSIHLFPPVTACPPSAGHAACLFICFPGLSLVLPPFSAGHVAFLFICLPCDFFLFVFQVWSLHCCFLPCRLEQVHLLRDCLRDCIPATLCNTQLCFPFRASVG